MKMANSEDFSLATDPYLRPYLEFHPHEVEYSESMLKAFTFATARISSVINRRNHLLVYVANPPFEIPIGKNRMVFLPANEVFATAIPGVIFLRLDQLLRCTPNEQAVTVLEELVHTMMGICDEPLARKIVAHMIPALVLTDTGYDLQELNRLNPVGSSR